MSYLYYLKGYTLTKFLEKFYFPWKYVIQLIVFQYFIFVHKVYYIIMKKYYPLVASLIYPTRRGEATSCPSVPRRRGRPLAWRRCCWRFCCWTLAAVSSGDSKSWKLELLEAPVGLTLASVCARRVAESKGLAPCCDWTWIYFKTLFNQEKLRR